MDLRWAQIRKWIEEIENLGPDSQFREPPLELSKKIEDKTRELQSLGFRVVRIPWFGEDRDLPWSGISYVNILCIDRKLFVPRFGLGQAENEVFRRIQESLPFNYEVVPILARHTLLSSGGIHCLVGIKRGRNRPTRAG